jgi:hypothetical protein
LPTLSAVAIWQSRTAWAKAGPVRRKKWNAPAAFAHPTVPHRS